MVGFDCRRRTLEADALNDIRIERPLEKPLDLSFCLASLPLCLLLFRLLLCRCFDLCCLLLKDIDEGITDDLPLLLRILNTLQPLEEEVGCVDDGEIDSKVFIQHLVDLLALVGAEDAIVDHDGMEAIANCLVHELCSNGRVNTSADGANDATLVAADGSDSLDLLVNEGRHLPVAVDTADSREAVEDLLAARRVCHLWVELDAEKWLFVVRDGSKWSRWRCSDPDKAFWDLLDNVRVRHPDLRLRAQRKLHPVSSSACL